MSTMRAELQMTTTAPSPTPEEPADVTDPGPASGKRAPAIRAQRLRHGYRGAEVLHGLSFEVVRGEVYALLGPNGAGRTTTVEILEGFIAATSGDVEVLGT